MCVKAFEQSLIKGLINDFLRGDKVFCRLLLHPLLNTTEVVGLRSPPLAFLKPNCEVREQRGIKGPVEDPVNDMAEKDP